MTIMKIQYATNLNFEKKLILFAVGMLAAWSPLVVGSAKAQISPKPAFEVASLKEEPPGGPVIPFRLTPHRTGGRLTWTASFGTYLRYAYNLPAWRISRSDYGMDIYTLEATMDPNTTEDQVRLMLQTLLTERFKIVSHWDTRSCSGYRLVVEKNGSKLKTATAAGVPPMPEYRKDTPPTAFEGRILTEGGGPGIFWIMGRGVSMPQLADEISKELATCVADQTGLTGKYYFGFQFASVSHPIDNADSPSIFTAVKDELGLGLEKQKGTAEIPVIDHYERKSSAN